LTDEISSEATNMQKDLEKIVVSSIKTSKDTSSARRQGWLERFRQSYLSDPEWQRRNPPAVRLAHAKAQEAASALSKIQEEARLAAIRLVRARNKRRTPAGNSASIKAFLDQSLTTSATLRERLNQDAGIDPTQAYEDSRKLMEFCLERLIEQEKSKA
jgi:hypothetical protein